MKVNLKHKHCPINSNATGSFVVIPEFEIEFDNTFKNGWIIGSLISSEETEEIGTKILKSIDPEATKAVATGITPEEGLLIMNFFSRPENEQFRFVTQAFQKTLIDHITKI